MRRRWIWLLLCLPALFGAVVHVAVSLGPRIGWRPTYTPVDLRQLGNFPLDRVVGTIADVPLHLRDLDGRLIELSGMMWSGTSSFAPSQFQLIARFPSSSHGPPYVQDRIFARMRDRKPVSISISPVFVRGTLHVRPIHDVDGVIVSLFDMDVDLVSAVPPGSGRGRVVDMLLRYPLMSGVAFSGLLFIGWQFPRWARAGRARGRTRHGLCPQCGYDLRASPLRCPECGHAVPSW